MLNKNRFYMQDAKVKGDFHKENVLLEHGNYNYFQCFLEISVCLNSLTWLSRGPACRIHLESKECVQ